MPEKSSYVMCVVMGGCCQLSNDGEKKVRIVLPDAAEMSRAMKKYEPAMSMAGKSVSMGCLTGARRPGLLFTVLAFRLHCQKHRCTFLFIKT